MKQKTSRESHLKKGRRIRSLIALEFQGMSLNEFHLEDALRDPDEFQIRRCDIWDVLRRAPHLGKPGARRVLIKSKVWAHAKLGDLSDEERARIIAVLPPRARKK